MAKCNYCGSNIFIGGVRVGEERYCNARCQQNAYILAVTKNVPQSTVDRQVNEVWQGNCPKCHNSGPVDVHRVHQVWSAVLLTRWTTTPVVSCRRCARRRQLGGAAFSLFFGWWGFPWGLVLTPVQITRNIVAMTGGPDSSKPSKDLQKLVLVNIGRQMGAKPN